MLYLKYLNKLSRYIPLLITIVLFLITITAPKIVFATHAATVNGEIESRPSPVSRRQCVAGTNVGNLCNQNADCPGSTCVDRNVFNISVGMSYNAPAADITAVQNLITAASTVLFDITDGQAEIGVATILNNAPTTTNADLVVSPALCTSGTNIGNVCANNNNCLPNTGPVVNRGSCGVGWQGSSGHYRNNGSMFVSINNINSTANNGRVLAHEFVHLVFDARDEYESRAAGCGAVLPGAANCPDAAAGQPFCLMDRNGTELCWGHGNATNLTDLTGGTHDATDVTEQSRCRSNRSCWHQVVWSWPNTFLMPVGAPDPAANGAVVNPPNFTVVDTTVRAVLVLDESGSMTNGLPTRMNRLKVAANDFITMAPNGAELGIVSYATNAETTSGRTNVPIAALGVNRTAWTNPVNALSPATRTNIGDGLQKARDMITAAGGATGNTFIVLMTDGRNNEPAPTATAAADLQAQINALLAAGIPVYVTCTGGDLGVQSQCSEIASGTNGFYVDSADAARLPEAFVDLHERLQGYEILDSIYGYLSKKSSGHKTIYVDKGSESATFTLQWTNPSANAEMRVIDPDGTAYDTQWMQQGRYIRIANPKPGIWDLVIDPIGSTNSKYVARGYTKNRKQSLAASIRYATHLPSSEIYVYAFPRGAAGALTSTDGKITAQITLPDGKTELIELLDKGRDAAGHGDDMPGDGVFTGSFRNTAQKGAYGVTVKSSINNWVLGSDSHTENPAYRSPQFNREVRLSAAVGDPGDVVAHPEDDPIGGTTTPGINNTILILIVILLIIIIILIWRCCCHRKG